MFGEKSFKNSNTSTLQRKNLVVSELNVIFAPKSRTMRAVIQRVSEASVTIDGQLKSRIGKGYLILLGVCEEDTQDDVEWLVKKVGNLRVFDDENGVMNRSIMTLRAKYWWSVSSRCLPATKKATVPHGYVLLVTRLASPSTSCSASVSVKRYKSPVEQVNLGLICR